MEITKRTIYEISINPANITQSDLDVLNSNMQVGKYIISSLKMQDGYIIFELKQKPNVPETSSHNLFKTEDKQDIAKINNSNTRNCDLKIPSELKSLINASEKKRFY